MYFSWSERVPKADALRCCGAGQGRFAVSCKGDEGRIGPARRAGISFLFANAFTLPAEHNSQTYPRARALQHSTASCKATSRYGTSLRGQTAPRPAASIRRPDTSMIRSAYCRCGRTSAMIEASRVERNLLQHSSVRCGESAVTAARVIPPMTLNATHRSAGY